MSKTFEHFPKDSECPICLTNEDRECFLMTIDGTDDDGICEGQPTHVDCVGFGKFRYNKKQRVIYYKL